MKDEDLASSSPSSSSSSSSSDDDSTEEQLQRMDEKLQRRRQQQEQRHDDLSANGDLDSLCSDVYKAIDESVKRHYTTSALSDVSSMEEAPDKRPAVVNVDRQSNSVGDSHSRSIETRERCHMVESTVATLPRDVSFEPKDGIESPRHCQQQGVRNDGNFRTTANRALLELDGSTESLPPSSSLGLTPPEPSKARRVEQLRQPNGSANTFSKGTAQRIANPYKTDKTPPKPSATINPYRSITSSTTRTTSDVDSSSPLLTPHPPTPRDKSPLLLTPYPPTPKPPKGQDPLKNRVSASAAICPVANTIAFEEESSTNEPSWRDRAATEVRSENTLPARDAVDFMSDGLGSGKGTNKPSESITEEDDFSALFFDDDESDYQASNGPKNDQAETKRSKLC
jgi:hypothetical protein